jgi:hypothetical protein
LLGLWPAGVKAGRFRRRGNEIGRQWRRPGVRPSHRVPELAKSRNERIYVLEVLHVFA